MKLKCLFMAVVVLAAGIGGSRGQVWSVNIVGYINLTVNPGLAGRFNRKLRFESYTPDELVEIAVRYGNPRATVIEPAAKAGAAESVTQAQAAESMVCARAISIMARLP